MLKHVTTMWIEKKSREREGGGSSSISYEALKGGGKKKVKPQSRGFKSHTCDGSEGH